MSEKEYKPNKKTKEKIKVIKQAYADEGRLTLRRIYYILLSKGLIQHSDNSYKGLSKLLTKLRINGFIEPSMIIDRHRNLTKRTTYSDFQEAFDNLCYTYTKNSMLNQEKYVEVWIEKDTMNSIFLEDCYFNDVPLIVSKGFTSYTFKYEALERFKQQDKPIVILYFGDFDCEGEYIPKVLEDFFSNEDLDIEFKKILLNEEDIKNLKGFAIKDKGLTNSFQLRKAYVKDFLKKYGKVKYEVEALPFNEVKKRFLDALHSEINLQVVENNGLESESDISEWKEYNLKESDENETK